MEPLHWIGGQVEFEYNPRIEAYDVSDYHASSEMTNPWGDAGLMRSRLQYSLEMAFGSWRA
ncbi:hypothetical protein HJO_04935 [Hyphomonas johnsonii MHS-2]|jgi:hypothetical protein|uniref:Uncharacterized protein n=1 Tax=Hyphomonas johnsonii MHS-2 TaxID=1280950 RepID=A0A059FW72_9PROT|nr:hypothetical protein HJO_04935 [Hyphomonas johnsonii MHS-2]